MKENACTGFYARLLGGFSLSYEGRLLSIDANPQCRYMQILLALLKAGKDGVERTKLLEISQPGAQDMKARMNNFRQQVYMLRKAIQKAGFPEGKYIVGKGLRYYFTFDYEYRADTDVLDQMISRMRSGAPEEELQKIYLNYCRAYTGEFLPLLSGEEWATIISAYYQKWYTSSLNELCISLKARGEYEELLSLCSTASQIHPYDGWQKVQTECLIALNRPKEALKVYEKASELLYEELGITIDESGLGGYDEISSPQSYISCVMANVKEGLTEKNRSSGAYCCSFPSFIDIYRIVTRISERDGKKNLLLLCTLSDGSESFGQAAAESKRDECLEAAMDLFQGVLANGIRNEDVYTRYSKNQFLALLVGVTGGNGEEVIARLKRGWMEINQEKKARIGFAVQEAENFCA